ncbi:MAG: tail fiber domain-containing protein [Ekhidna sp.]
MKKFLTLSLMILSCYTYAQKIPFQGRLLDNGKPFNGTSTIEFNIASPSWSETKSNINVTDGYYSVVLGETTPLPDTLFSNSSEVELNITVNGEALSPVILYSSLLPYTGPQGIEVDTLRAFMAEAIGVNGEGKARISTTNNGYDGTMSLTDSLGRTGNFMRTRKAGGYLQLAQQDFTDDSFKSAALMATSEDQNSFMELYGGNVANNGISSLILAYGSNIDLNGPIADGYRRGGIDIRNYYGNFTHNIFSEHLGTSTISHINLNASQDDSDTQFTLNLNSGDGITSGGFISLRDVDQSETISLDGTTGTINAQQVLIDGSPIGGSDGGTIQPDSVRSRSVRVVDADGTIKSDLNVFGGTNAGSLVLYGANDSTKVILGSVGGGYGGFLGLYDSLRNIGANLRVTNKGQGNLFMNNEAHNNVGWFGGLNNDGFFQLVSYDDTETASGAALIGSFADGNLPEYYLEGSAQENFGLGRFMVTPLGNSAEETARMEINRSNGGGQAVMTISQDDAGADPTGSNGSVDLWGDESINIQLGSQGFEDHDLPVINMYGSIDNGTGWWYNAAQFNAAKTGDGTQEFGNVTLYNNEVGASSQTANFTGNINESGNGGLELLKASGTLGMFATGEGYIQLFDNSELDRVTLDGVNGTLDLRSDGSNDEFMNIRSGGISGGSSSFENGFNLNYDASGGALLEMFSGSNLNVFLNGTNGDISAQGQIFGNTLASTDGSVQTSDRRLKKNIEDLESPLAKTLQMRGVSYTWKDESKSQRNQIGVIAQEVEEIYPEFVRTDEEGMKAVNYAQMSAVLIEAIKELNAKVEKLESENSTLKASLSEVETLRTDMDRLMKMLGSSKAASK